jgi:UDP-glucose 4-epimerase
VAILLTGSAGYLGSHTALALLAHGYAVVGVDNFSNSSAQVNDRIRRLAEQHQPGSSARFSFAQLDVADQTGIHALLNQNNVAACIHFAAFKSVAESEQQPLAYLHNNVGGLLSLLQALQVKHIFKLVFSSSASVYGNPASVPVKETAPLQPVSTYGQTKLMGEQILNTLVARNNNTDATDWRIGSLRYFNPVGAHPSGELGEQPRNIPHNLMPCIAQTAAGLRQQLTIFGDDYPTPDGTSVRDYIHVQDLALGHVAAMNRLLTQEGSFTVNLGSGQGASVKELVSTFEMVNAVKVPYTIGPRRPGDAAACYADTNQAKHLLGWESKYTLQDMCRDAWRWQQNLMRN